MNRRLPLLNRLSLTPKILAITFLVGLLVWVIMDRVQYRTLEARLQAQLTQRLDEQALHDRVLFDRHVRTFGKAVKLFASQQRMSDYIRGAWKGRDHDQLIMHSSPPMWYPKPSVARTFVAPQNAMLLGPRGRICEVFSTRGSAPDALMENNDLLELLTHNETMMTKVGGVPHVLAMEKIHDEEGNITAYLLLASPLDSEFIRQSQPILTETHITALIHDEPARVLASSAPEVLPSGTLLSDLEGEFLVTGKSFFDYGISDLLLQFTTFISTEEVDALTGEIMGAERMQKALLATALIISFAIIIIIITRRINALSTGMVKFSREHLGLATEELHSGDQLEMLGEQFTRLEAGILGARLSLMKANEELKARNTELEDALLAAKEADKAKGEFLANMSHELRTPLSGILGMTEILLESELNEYQTDYLKTVHIAADSLRVIINEILDFSKITARKLDIQEDPFNMRQLFGGTIEPLAVLAEEKDISLVFDIHTDVPDFVVGDQGKLRQILNNLIGNAIKFTEEGVVCVKLNSISRTGEEAVVNFQVIDTGIGVPLELQEHIFESFSQADGSATRRFGGTGLGLAISSELVRLMGGELKLTSKVAEGSNFHFSLPFKLPGDNVDTMDVQPAGPMDEPEAASLNIMLAEDNVINQKLAVTILEKSGHRVTVADNGLKAIELFKGSKFDIILMDVMMPIMDGLTATMKIRKLEASGTGGHIPIIAMTARAMEGDKEKCIEAGMDDYISKPINIHKLMVMVKKAL